MSGSSEQQPVSPVGDPLAASSSGLVVREDRFFINAKVVVYAALSGMVSFLPDGTIYGCNHHFAVMLFGYSQEELLKKVRVVIYVSHCIIQNLGAGKGRHPPRPSLPQSVPKNH